MKRLIVSNDTPEISGKKGNGFVSEFIANGNKYTIRSADDGIGIMRFSQLQKMGSVVGYDATFDNQFKNWGELENIILSDEPISSIKKKSLLHISAVRDGLLEATKSKYQYAFYLCTLFIVREGEDLSTWSNSEAEAKINDWNIEQIHEQDFLSLALVTIPNFLNAYKLVNQGMKDVQMKKKQVAGIMDENAS